MNLKITDKDGDYIRIEESQDFLCLITVNGEVFGCSKEHAKKIIECIEDTLANPIKKINQ